MVVLKFRSSTMSIFLVIAGSLSMRFHTIDAASIKAHPQVCQSAACKNFANSVLQKMNWSVDPCDNFYEFVCGNFSRNALISPSRSQTNAIHQLRDVVLYKLRDNIENQITDKDPEAFQKLLTYYKTCMDEDQIEKTSNNDFARILRQFGGWPVLVGKSYDDSVFDWRRTTRIIGEMGYSSNYFFSVDIATDLKNNTKNLLYLDQSKLGISQAYLSQGLQNNIVKAYFKYMIDVAEIFGADREQAKLELAESLNFEIELSKISLSETERRAVEIMYNPMKISELQEKYPYNSNWLEDLNGLLSPFYSLTEDDVVIVSVPSFFEQLGNLLARTPNRVLANYAMWKVAYESGTYLGEKVREANREFQVSLNGNRNKSPRWQRCINYASRDLYVATSSLYVRKNFDKASKDGVMEMFRHLRRSFKNILSEVDWMDETTKIAAIKKLDQTVPLVGYFDESLDDKKINDYYKEFKLCPKSFLKTVLSYQRFVSDKQLKTFGDPVPRVDWTNSYSASDVNAFYKPDANTIQFPAGILQGDFYTEGNPKYVNYAAVGSVIGHEMTHGFDDQGSHFDGEGNMVDWWKAETKKEFMKRAKCIVDQYSSYIDPQAEMNLNGNLTLGENIADNGGLKEAYLAYTAYEEENGKEPILPGFEDFVPKQLFWISFGNIWCTKYRTEYLKNLITTNPHAPSQFRIIGSVTNNPHFAKDFNCPSGSPMNPVSKCSVW